MRKLLLACLLSAATADAGIIYFPARGGGGAWGTITGTLSAQTDLQTALNLKLTDPGSAGCLGRTTSSVTVARTLTAAAGVTITFGDCQSGDPTIGADLSIVSSFSSGTASVSGTGTIGTFYFETDRPGIFAYPATDTEHWLLSIAAGTAAGSLFQTSAADTLAAITSSDDNVLVSDGSTWAKKAIADCDDSGGNHLNYDTGTNAFSCGTSSSGGGTVDNSIASGRLTLTTGVPVTTSDVTASTTIYYAPYKGNRIALYSGAAWEIVTFSEVTCALGTLTSGKNYDVFIYNSGGTATCEFSAAWTNDSTRADALARQDGVLVKSGTTTRRYVGTFRTISTTQTADSGGGTTTQVGSQRFLWNMYNRVGSWMRVIDTANSWSYNTSGWHVANSATGPLNCIEFVVGDPGPIVQFTAVSTHEQNGASTGAGNAVGYDSTSTPSGLRGFVNLGANPEYKELVASYSTTPVVGYHYGCWLEYTSDNGATTFYGDVGGTAHQHGMSGEFER